MVQFILICGSEAYRSGSVVIEMPEFTEEQNNLARQKIQRLLNDKPPTNWSIPEEYTAKAFEIAHTAQNSPAKAIIDAQSFIEGLKARNLKRQEKLIKARKLRADLIALAEDPAGRKREPAKKSTSAVPKRFSNWLNGTRQAPRTVVDDVDEETLEEIIEQGGDADKGLMAKVPDEAIAATRARIRAAEKAGTANAQPIEPTRKPPGCLFFLFRPPSKKKDASSPDPEDHGIPLPLTNAGTRGWQGLLQRWLLTTLNATPTSGLNWMEVTKDGLQIYQPLATVSQRTINHKQVRDGQVVLSVDPPAYFDSFLGVLRQFRKDVDTPWGEIVAYEGGSGRVIARAIALAPGRKLKQIRLALELLHLAENEAEGFRRIPQLSDLLLYVKNDVFSTDENAEVT